MTLRHDAVGRLSLAKDRTVDSQEVFTIEPPVLVSDEQRVDFIAAAWYWARQFEPNPDFQAAYVAELCEAVGHEPPAPDAEAPTLH